MATSITKDITITRTLWEHSTICIYQDFPLLRYQIEYNFLFSLSLRIGSDQPSGTPEAASHQGDFLRDACIRAAMHYSILELNVRCIRDVADVAYSGSQRASTAATKGRLIHSKGPSVERWKSGKPGG